MIWNQREFYADQIAKCCIAHEFLTRNIPDENCCSLVERNYHGREVQKYDNEIREVIIVGTCIYSVEFCLLVEVESAHCNLEKFERFVWKVVETSEHRMQQYYCCTSIRNRCNSSILQFLKEKRLMNLCIMRIDVFAL